MDMLKRYAEGRCTKEERILVEEWFEQYDAMSPIDENNFNAHLMELDRRIKKSREMRRISFWNWSLNIAAVLILSIAILWKTDFFNPKPVKFQTIADIKAPHASNAMIVLDDESMYSLDSLRQGDTLQAKGYAITKLPNGELLYLHTGSSAAIVRNTIRTMSGGTTHVKLDDGSLVWINANSELTYPISFVGTNREVRLQGEGYFEIAKQFDQQGNSVPFYVRGADQTIKVLGTKFNVQFNEGHATALLEGKVAIANSGSALGDTEDLNFPVTLRPNQLYREGQLENIADATRYTDWKDGYFDLNHLTIYDLVPKLSNWYGVEIRVDQALERLPMFGRIRRNNDLSAVLQTMAEVYPITYHLDGGILWIQKKIN